MECLLKTRAQRHARCSLSRIMPCKKSGTDVLQPARAHPQPAPKIGALVESSSCARTLSPSTRSIFHRSKRLRFWPPDLELAGPQSCLAGSAASQLTYLWWPPRNCERALRIQFRLTKGRVIPNISPLGGGLRETHFIDLFIHILWRRC